jgi:starch synthase
MIAQKILVTGYEVVPFYKRGGLGDVLGSLPVALQKLGVDARLVMPNYKSISKQFPQRKIGSFHVVFDKKDEEVVIFQGTLPKTTVSVYFLTNRRLISVINLKKKRIEEFIFFDLAVAAFLNWLEDQDDFVPDLVHCNDWHTALIPLLLKKRMHSSIKTLLTIHNLGYQGKGSLSVLDQAGIDDKELRVLSRNNPVTELNALGEGILHASAISTVSPEYAREISHAHKRSKIYHYFRLREKEYGNKLRLPGILNGIDEQVWDPRTDAYIARKYGLEDVAEAKRDCKTALLRRYKLADRPTFVFVGRMAAQKGIPVIIGAAEMLVRADCNVLLLGSGDAPIESLVKQIVKRYPQQIACELSYSEEDAHRFYAGADFLLVPSLYEPCGLIQMVGMRYGTIPLASRTGGLIDTISDGKTGYLFEPGSSRGLAGAVNRALERFADQKAFLHMRKTCMKEDFSWDTSAKEYKKLYSATINEEG